MVKENKQKQELKMRKRLRDDFPFYALNALKIKTKKSEILPFKMNKAQAYTHKIAEKQKAEKGFVRLIVLKARQQGLSTYIEGRGYWKTSHIQGYNSFILTHLADATKNLFGMCKRYHKHCPDFCRPSISASNENALIFGEIDSKFGVGTAGNAEIGRSATLNFFHGSEVAFWKNAKAIIKGALQAVPRVAGSEVWFESTANGMSNEFYEVWKKAEKGEGDFLPVFIPWFWDDGYAVEAPDDFEFTKDEIKLVKKYKLTTEQLYWRRLKITEMGEKEFQQEYPATADEAFEGGILTGKVYEIDEDDLFIKPFEIPDYFLRVGGLDFGWDPDPTACIQVAYDKDNDIVYWVGEYGANERTPSSHVNNLNNMNWTWFPWVCDPFGGSQRAQKDGVTMISNYQKAGLQVSLAERTGVFAGCKEVYERMLDGRLKIFKSLVRTRQEWRYYVFDEKTGQPVDKNNHFMDGGRYVTVSGLAIAQSMHQHRRNKHGSSRASSAWGV